MNRLIRALEEGAAALNWTFGDQPMPPQETDQATREADRIDREQRQERDYARERHNAS